MKILKKAFLLFFIMVLSVMAPVSASAEDHHQYYVSQDSGNDEKSGCDWAHAKKTIQAAIEAASPGDTVIVNKAKLEYREEIHIDKDLYLIGLNQPILTGSVSVNYYRELFEENGGVLEPKDKATKAYIQGFKITENGFANFECQAIIKNCEFTHIKNDNRNGWPVIYNFGNSYLVNCSFHDNALELHNAGVILNFWLIYLIHCDIGHNSWPYIDNAHTVFWDTYTKEHAEKRAKDEGYGDSWKRWLKNVNINMTTANINDLDQIIGKINGACLNNGPLF